MSRQFYIKPFFSKKLFCCTCIAIFLEVLFAYPLYAQSQKDIGDYGHDFVEKLNSPAYAIPNGPYTPDWKSLANHNAAPEWFRDAKFGIYAHWGVYSAIAHYTDAWYPCYMYDTSTAVYKRHLKTYGSPLKFGYPDFIPLFKGERFDAGAWAKLFKEAGAKFSGPVAEHHDGFSMWDTEWTPWNAMKKGPRRDIVGELEKAIRGNGMKFMTSFHHARNEIWMDNGKWVGHYAGIKKYFPSLLDDPETNILYGYMPRSIFLAEWRGKVEEVINRYRPDMMWFDGDLGYIPDSVLTKYLAFYLNKSNKEGRDVVITYKHSQLPSDVGVQDFERGGVDRLEKVPWLTDNSIADNAWGYIEGMKLKTAKDIINELADVVSKNGNMLLNVAPRPDGSIPEDQQKILREVGAWLTLNGEAIYGTRPWWKFGEGPRQIKKTGSFVEKLQYTGEDIRYTRKGNTIYAILLGWPGAAHKVLLKSWAKNAYFGPTIKVDRVSMVGSSENIQWEWKTNGLTVTTPSQAPDEKAIVFRIETTQY